ncbi:MAG: thrombospondin type 3 repeat-containing protein, partial [Nitrosopumilus sp.]
MNGSIFLVFGVLVLSLFSVPLSISADANYQENQIPIKPKIGEIRTLPLVKPDISFDRASYEPDQTVTVTVNDRYANKDPNAVDKISTVTVTGAATGQSSSFVISETGVNTGIFDRELGVAKFWAPNPPDTIKATYTYNHGDTNSGTVSVTAKVVAPAPTDTDRDGVPDEKDNCPKEAGPANNKGCPVKIERIPTPVPVPPRPVPVEPKDSDGDGVPDNEDACPREYGPANNRGCPAKEPVPAPTRDDTPPFLIVPSDIVTDATTTQGVKVAYIVTAIDDVDGELKPTCSK